MNKVLPLLIVPPLFLIFFLNVENLTVKLDNKKNYPVLESSESKVFQNKKDEEITISNENLSNKNAGIKLDDSKPVLSKSEQSISPRLPKIYYEITKKPSG